MNNSNNGKNKMAHVLFEVNKRDRTIICHIRECFGDGSDFHGMPLGDKDFEIEETTREFKRFLRFFQNGFPEQKLDIIKVTK